MLGLGISLVNNKRIDSGPPPDVQAPTVQSATVENANPDRLVVVFSEAVNITNVNGLSLNGYWTAVTVSSILSGNGTDTVTFQLSDALHYNRSGGFIYSGSNTITDLASNPLAAGSTAITNNVADKMLSMAFDVYANKHSIVPSPGTQGETVTAWNDLSGNARHFTTSVNTPEIDLNGADGPSINFGSDANVLEKMSLVDANVGKFDLGVDEFSVVWRIGAKLAVDGIIIGKVDGADGGANWTVQADSSNRIIVNLGGNLSSSINRNNGFNALYVLVVTTTNWTLYEDGVQLATASLGTDNTSAATDTRPVHIGAKHNNGFSVEVEINLVAFKKAALTSQQRTDIRNQWQIN